MPSKPEPSNNISFGLSCWNCSALGVRLSPRASRCRWGCPCGIFQGNGPTPQVSSPISTGGGALLRSALRGADHALERFPFTLNAKSIYPWKQAHFHPRHRQNHAYVPRFFDASRYSLYGTTKYSTLKPAKSSLCPFFPQFPTTDHRPPSSTSPQNQHHGRLGTPRARRL